MHVKFFSHEKAELSICFLLISTSIMELSPFFANMVANIFSYFVACLLTLTGDLGEWSS